MTRHNMHFPEVVVSILNWNSFPQTLRCLESFKAIKYPALTLCVTDNHSLDFDEVQLKQRFPSLHVFLNQENVGFAKGHEQALAFAQTRSVELLWLLNNDTEVFENTLLALIEAYKKNGLGLYGSMAIDKEGLPRPDAIYRANPINKLRTDFEEISIEELTNGQTLSVATLTGYSMLIPIEVISKHGFMDSKYFLYYEETDYCLTLLKKGIPSYWVSASRVFHEKQGSTKNQTELLEVMDYYLYRNLFLFLNEHAPISRTVHFLGRFTMRFLSANVFRKNKVPRLTSKHLIGIWHGLSGRSGKFYAPEDHLRSGS